MMNQGPYEKRLLRHTLRKMGSILGARQGMPSLDPTLSPLLQCIQLIGEASGIEFSLPEKRIEEDAEPLLLVADICEKSRVRYRRILLKGDWWTTMSTPTLGFLAEKATPVVLLPLEKGACELFDPVEGKRAVLDAELAKAVDVVGVAFYSPLPEEETRLSKLVPFFLRRVKRDLLALLLVGVLASGVSLFLPFANKVFFDAVIPDTDIPLFWQLNMGIFVATVAGATFSLVRQFVTVRVDGMMGNNFQAGLWDRLLRLPPHFFRDYSSGDLAQRVNLIQQLHDVLSQRSLGVLLSAIFSALYLIPMLYYSPKLTLMGVAIIALGLGISLIATFLKLPLLRRRLEVEGKIHGFLVQVIAGMSKLRIAGAEQRAFCHWAEQYYEAEGLRMRLRTIENVVSVVNSILPILSMGLIFAVAMYWILPGDGVESAGLSVGEFLAFNAAFTPFSMGLWDLSAITTQIAEVAPHWRRARVLLDAPMEERSSKNHPGILQGHVSVEHMTLSYNEEGPPVLLDVSIHAAPGEFVGIVGPSGCGKSSLLRALIGFEPVDRGKVSYDHKDLGSLAAGEVRRQIGTVLQGSQIFSGSIVENITCGRACTPEQIIEAVQASSLVEVLQELPMGLDTRLPPGGSTLSGGQCQRVLLARALLTRPPILILDEATSALDSMTQERVMKALEAMSCTRIVVAHRLSSLKRADRIYVMDQGQIVETGSFNELAQGSGLFAKLLAVQS